MPDDAKLYINLTPEQEELLDKLEEVMRSLVGAGISLPELEDTLYCILQSLTRPQPCPK